ncbi:MAG: hypothetical protein IKD22_01440 [Lentisphaeria bacterium]|nr:hypothetical protein [Lentisphaeria bacterium]
MTAAPDNHIFRAAHAAFETLFGVPETSGVFTPSDTPFAARLRSFFAVAADPAAENAPRRCAVMVNEFTRILRGENFAAALAAELFTAITALQVLPRDFTPQLSENGTFIVDRCAQIIKALQEWQRQLAGEAAGMILPGNRELFSLLPDSDDPEAIAAWLLRGDPFAGGKVFSWQAGKFLRIAPDAVKPVEKFFGFPGIRSAYAEHFAAFAAGKSNLPLLINSLPGYGKTSMVLSYALNFPGLTPILAAPEILEHDWTRVVSTLALRKDHRFILFFDDIDPRQIDWYNFRTNVGGAFTPPENVMPVLTANYEFHPSILSRGRKLSYPVFDEVRCQEMVEDFLKSFGMLHPPANLISMIAADYTEEFGQKRFTELSPRTLMRYLKIYETDPGKRRTMMTLSTGEVITRPDGELFYEFNINLMRSLYGDTYIQQLLKERLREL